MRFAILACALLVCWTGPARAQPAQPQAASTFEASRLLEMVAPSFPSAPAASGEEGWVILNFMIDEEGNSFEPMVIDSMGDKRFVDAALKALGDSKFAPASVAGKPITSSSIMRYTFVLEGNPSGARPDFVARYTRLVTAINADEHEAAQAALEELGKGGARSLYEDAYLNLGRYFYAAKYGTSEEQMTYLSRALFFDNADTYETYMPEEDVQKFWPQLFVLQARNGRLAEALQTYDVIAAIGAEEAHASLTEAVTRFRGIATDDTSYAVNAKTNSSGSWNIGLFKDEFYLDNLESNIREIKLRCDKKYVVFKYEADIKYHVPAELGQCQLEVLGDADTAFQLVQL